MWIKVLPGLLPLLCAAPVWGQVIVDDGGPGSVVGESTSLVLDSSGNPVISYQDDSNGNLKLAVCADSACNTTPIIRTLDHGGGDSVGSHTSLVLDSSDNPLISYHDETNGNLKLAVCTDPACNTTPIIRTLDHGGGDVVGRYTSLKLDGSGNPVISYYDFTNRDLKLAVCADPTCSAMPTVRIVDDGGDDSVGSHTSLVLNAAGNPIISYFDISNQDLKLAVCADPTCSAPPTLRTLDGGGGDPVGWHTTLVLNGSGNPVISYSDLGAAVFFFFSDAVKLAVCTDPTCGVPPIIRTVDDSGDDWVGRFSAMALDGSGNPVISYFDETNGLLKLAVCADATCSAPPNIRIVDGGGDRVGRFNALALDGMAHSVISYHDDSNGHLKLARVRLSTGIMQDGFEGQAR